MASTVLIVGASRGLGLEFVRQYRAAGAQVVATARTDEGLAAISALGATAIKLDVALDVNNTASASGLAWQIDGHQFDEVVFVAGVYGPHTSGLETPTEADFNAVMHANVLGPMRVLPQLQDALAPGAKLAILSSRMGSIGLRTSTVGWLYRARTDMGGEGADIDVATSVAGMRAVLASAKPEHNGSFFNYDGQVLAW